MGRPRRVSLWLVSGLIMLAVAACERGKPAPPTTEIKSVDDWFPIKVGDRTVRMQVAALEPEMERGLMYRQSLGTDDGMIFVYAKPQQQSFWMRNTTVPLDIGFFDAAGGLKEVYPMYPLDERAVSSHSRDIQFCLEMNQGWFQRASVKAGARLDLAALAAALRARGLKPEADGLH